MKKVKILSSDRELYGILSRWIEEMGFELAPDTDIKRDGKRGSDIGAENKSDTGTVPAADTLFIIDCETYADRGEYITRCAHDMALFLCFIDNKDGECAGINADINADMNADGDFITLSRPFTKLEFFEAVNNLADNVSVGVRCDAKRRRVYRRGVYVALTEKEYAVFRLLYDNKGGFVSRDMISQIACSGQQKTNAADVYICMLRKKLAPLLGDRCIVTARGRGYGIIER